MKNRIIIIIGVIIFIVLIAFYIFNANFTPKNPNDELLNKISKLELKIDSLNKFKDSIRTVIDSTHIKIITNEKHYQERVNTIIHQSSSADSSFIADYIRLYSIKDTMSYSE